MLVMLKPQISFPTNHTFFIRKKLIKRERERGDDDSDGNDNNNSNNNRKIETLTFIIHETYYIALYIHEQQYIYIRVCLL